MNNLPEIIVKVSGELRSSNIDDIRPIFDDFLGNALTELETDDDFYAAELQSKIGRDAARQCTLAIKAIIEQTSAINDVVKELESYSDKFNAMALKQEKLIKLQKDILRINEMKKREHDYIIHCEALEVDIAPVKLIITNWQRPNFIGAMKNKKTLPSICEALDSELVRAKIDAVVLAKSIRKNLNIIYEHKEYSFLFTDIQQLAYRDNIFEVIEERIHNYVKNKSSIPVKSTEQLKEQAERIRQSALRCDSPSNRTEELKRAKILEDKAESIEGKIGFRYAKEYISSYGGDIVTLTELFTLAWNDGFNSSKT